MKTLRRYIESGSVFFITCVTYDREPLLLELPSLFLESWPGVVPLAWVLMPQHFHALLDVNSTTVSMLMHSFKITYSRRFRDRVRAGWVWQNRFWDHVIRDQVDMNRHLDYIHYNPVHHGQVKDPFTYPYSTLKSWSDRGFYTRDWGVIDKLEFEGEFGE
ncbi:MAG: transposase [Candidatus Zixiibacteriota bacterium]